MPSNLNGQNQEGRKVASGGDGKESMRLFLKTGRCPSYNLVVEVVLK